MRLSPIALLAALMTAGVLVAPAARADIGPVAPCAANEHHQYLYGHHCVPNGSHLEQDSDGHVEFVQNGSSLAKSPPPKVDPPTPPPTSTFATPPEPTESPRPPPQGPPLFVEPPHERGCACDLREPAQSLPLGAFGLAALLFTVSRRRAARAKRAP
ncbi:MAG: hypothetical protein ABI193_19900 [Minicystis sp.]